MIVLSLFGRCHLYQGQVLGFSEIHDSPLDVPDDPVYERSGRTRH